MSRPHHLFFIPLCSVSSHNETIRNPASLSSVQKHSSPALQNWIAQCAVLQEGEESDTKNLATHFYLLHSLNCSDGKQERGMAEKSLAPHPAPSVTLLVTGRAVRQDHKRPRQLMPTANYMKESRQKQKDHSQDGALRGQIVQDNF